MEQVAMEQVAMITQLVQDMIAMNSTEKEWGHFLLNLNRKVGDLTSIVSDIPEQREWEVAYVARRVEKEAKLAREQEAKAWEEMRLKDKKNERRRELYKLNKAKKEQK
jgi:hypothetical protein